MTNQTKSQTASPTTDQILSGIAKGIWRKEDNDGEPPVPTLANLQNFTQNVQENDWVVIGMGRRYDVLRPDEYQALSDDIGNMIPKLISLGEHMKSFFKSDEGRILFSMRTLDPDLPWTIGKQLSKILVSIPESEREAWLEEAQASIKEKQAEYEAKTQKKKESQPKEGKGDITAKDSFYAVQPEHFQPIANYILRTAGEPTEKRLQWLHKAWDNAHREENGLKHPLVLIVKAWLQEQLPKIDPERRKDTGILHANIRDTYPLPRLSMTQNETAPAETEQLALISPLPQEGLQLELPGFVFPESELVPALPLVTYENAGGKPNQRGRGAPIDQRLFFNILVEYNHKMRGLYGLSRLNTTYRDVKEWLYPEGTTNPKKVLIPRLRKGLWDLHNLRFGWERREWNIISVDSLPTMNIKPSDSLTFTVRMPDGLNTNNGALIGIEPMRLYGAQSAPKFRAWIRLAYLWDAAKQRNGGNRVFATVPQGLRNKKGYLVDAKGELILTGKLRKTKAGWKYSNGKIPQTAWYHPLAIRTEKKERNPQADKVPVLSDSDLVKLFFDHTERKDSAFRECLRLARQYALEMQNDGRVVVETDQVNEKTGVKGWRILEPYRER